MQQHSLGSLNNTLVYNVNSQQCISQNDTGNHNSNNIQNLSNSTFLQEYDRFTSKKHGKLSVDNKNSHSKSWTGNHQLNDNSKIFHSSSKIKRSAEENSISSTKQYSRTGIRSVNPKKISLMTCEKKIGFNFSYAWKIGVGNLTSRVSPNNSSPSVINLSKPISNFELKKKHNPLASGESKKLRSHSFNSNLFNSPGLTKNKSMPYLFSQLQKITLPNNNYSISRTSNNANLNIKPFNLTTIPQPNKQTLNSKSMKYSGGGVGKGLLMQAPNSNKGTIVNDKNYEEETLVINNINQSSKKKFNKHKLRSMH